MTGAAPRDAARSQARRTSRWAPDWVRALLVLLALLFVFFWKPITTDGVYAPTDLLQRSTLFQLGSGEHVPKNPAASDVVQVIHPWLEYDRAAVRAGRLPLWNPYNAAGAPQLGNGQSAVFSVFTVPFYALSMRTALVVSAFLKLLCAGFGTYLFLRLLRVRHLPGLVGAVAFMFGSYNVVWLSWPLPSPAVLMPFALVAAELLARRRDPADQWLAAVGLALAVGANLVAGHPETTFFSVALVVAYLGFRIGCARTAVRERLARAGRAIAGLALGAALGAAQLVPFAEYTLRSANYTNRSDLVHTYLDGRFVALHILPKLLGNPTSYQDPSFNLVNFNEAVGFYIGALVLVLAGIGLTVAWRTRHFAAVFFTISAGLWILYTYDVAGLGSLVSSLPLVGLGLAGRSNVIWLFSVAVLAAFGTDAVVAIGHDAGAVARSVRIRWVAVVVAGSAVLVFGAWIAERLLRNMLSGQPGNPISSDESHRIAQDHMVFIAITFAAGVAAVVALLLARRAGVRVTASVLLLAMVFAQSGFLFRDYNPTIPDRFFYPTTSAVRAVRHITGADQTLMLGSAVMSPDVNVWYRQHSAETYDALGVREYDTLQRRLLRIPQSFKVAGVALGILLGGGDPKRAAALRTLGVRWLVTSNAYPYGRSVLRQQSAFVSPPPVVPPALPAAGAGTQTVLIRASGMNELVTAGPSGRAGQRCSLEIAVPTSREVLRRAEGECGGGLAAFSFRSLRLASSRWVDVTVTTAGAPAADAPRRRVVYDGVHTRVPGLVPVWQRSPNRIYRVPGAPKRYSSPARTVRVPGPKAALATVVRPGFEARETAVLEGRGTSRTGAPGRVTVLEETPERVRLRVDRTRPGWLVARISRFPGWKATVNGRSVSLATADYAFTGVPVPTGRSEVVLEYRPTSVRVGLLVSAAAVVVLLALGAWSLLRIRARRRTSA